MSLIECFRRAGCLVRSYSPSPGIDLCSRLSLSDGTEPARDGDHSASRYEDGARAPRNPWRQLTEAESRQLISPIPPADYARSVVIIRFPAPRSSRQIAAIRGDDPEAIEQGLFRAILEQCDIGEPIRCIGTIRSPPRLDTITVDPATRQRIGLHVDSWHKSSDGRTDRLPNRLSVNVGSEARYFLFLPVSLAEIRQILKANSVALPISPQDRTGVGRLFMERPPSAPVLRCRIEPWEAYLAGTENIVHDGSSLGQAEQDGTILCSAELACAPRRSPQTPRWKVDANPLPDHFVDRIPVNPLARRNSKIFIA